jgi:hypothetical protein
MTTYASHLDNNELTRLARGEREATAALIVHLAEFESSSTSRGRVTRLRADGDRPR